MSGNLATKARDPASEEVEEAEEEDVAGRVMKKVRKEGEKACRKGRKESKGLLVFESRLNKYLNPFSSWLFKFVFIFIFLE